MLSDACRSAAQASGVEAPLYPPTYLAPALRDGSAAILAAGPVAQFRVAVLCFLRFLCVEACRFRSCVNPRCLAHIELHMPGTLHIFRLDPRHTPEPKLEPQYQANYSLPGNNFAKAYTERKLKDFLRFAVGLDDDQVMQAVHQLHDTGKCTLADVELSVEELRALGLEQIPADF